MTILGLSIATKVDDLEWPWTSIHCFIVSVMRIVTKRLKLESCVVCYKVALYLSYLHIKFDDKTEGNPFEFQAYFTIRMCPKLNWSTLGYICSQMSLLLGLVTQCMATKVWLSDWRIVCRRRNVRLRTQIRKIFWSRSRPKERIPRQFSNTGVGFLASIVCVFFCCCWPGLY